MQKRKFYDYRQQNKIIFQIILSVMTTLSLTMEFGIPDYMNVNFTVSREFIVNLRESLNIDPLVSTVFCVSIMLFSVRVENLNKRKIKFCQYKVYYILCMAIGFVWLMAKSLMINDSLSNIYATEGQIIKSFIYYIGTVNLLILLGKLVFILIDCGNTKFLFDEYSDESIRKSGYRTFIFLMLIWFPHIIMAYPASIISDAWSQLSMFYGRKEFTSHHPPFHTWLIGMAVKMGEKIGSANLGLFLFIFCQSAIFAVVISYGIKTMKRLNAPKWLVILTKLIAVTSPYYTAYIGLITKDTLYSYFFLLFLIELVYMLLEPKKYWADNRHAVLFVLSSVLVMLFRNNGKYVIYPMLFVIVIIVKKDGLLFQSRKNTTKAVLCLLLIILIPILIGNILTKKYDIEKGSVKEMLSLPFQQTARYVVKHGEEITDEERQAIDKILDFDCLAENYNPRLSDEVKNTFNENSSYKDMVGYFKVWLYQFSKHPLTYVSATVNQNYRLLYPFKIQYLYLETYKNKSEFVELLGVKEVDQIEKREDNLKSFYTIMFNFPILDAFSIIAIYNLVLFYILIYVAYKRLYPVWIVASPLIISNLVIVAGPLVHPRYAFPIIYSIPI